MAGKGPRKPRKPASAGKGRTPKPDAPPIGQSSQGSDALAGEFQRAQQRMDEEIRIRAYQLFEERGRQEGHHHEDWVRAETEIRAQYQRAKSA